MALNNMKKVIFLGSKPIGYLTLEFLLKNSQTLGIEVVGVLSNLNMSFGTEHNMRSLAERFDVPFVEELDAILSFKDIDYLISVQYHLILKQAHIDVAQKLAVNLHMAPLPEYRGCNQFSFAIFNQAKVFGATLHRLESGIDNGNIIAEVRFNIPENATVKRLYDITFEKSLFLFTEEIASVFEGNYTLTPQETLFAERGTNIYYRKDISKLKELTLADNADELIRKVRATAMPGFEPPFILHKEQKYYIIPEEIYNKNSH
jgi:methionyl-tRNA formyltransferase